MNGREIGMMGSVMREGIFLDWRCSAFSPGDELGLEGLSAGGVRNQPDDYRLTLRF